MVGLLLEYGTPLQAEMDNGKTALSLLKREETTSDRLRETSVSFPPKFFYLFSYLFYVSTYRQEIYKSRFFGLNSYVIK